MSSLQIFKGAAAAGDLESMLRLIQEDGVDINAVLNNSEGTTALHAAARRDDTKAVRLLLENGADVNVKDIDGDTPLHEAVPTLETMQVLLEYKADARANNGAEQTALHFAIIRRAGLDAVQLLITHNANVNAADAYGRTALHMALDEGGYSLGVVQLLVEHKADVNKADYLGKTPLHNRRITAPALKLLLSGDATVDAKDHLHHTPLHTFVVNNNTTAVKALLDYLWLQNCDHPGIAESILMCVDKGRGRLPFHHIESTRMLRLFLEQPLSKSYQVPQVCNYMLVARDGDGRTLLDIVHARFPITRKELTAYLGSYTKLPLAVSEETTVAMCATPQNGEHKRQRLGNDGVAVRINPKLENGFQRTIATAFLVRKWWIPYSSHDGVDENTQMLLPVELKCAIMGYVTLTDIMKIQPRN